MKIRNDFVTNSSSSSFIVSTKDRKNLKTFVTIQVDLANLLESTLKTKKDIEEYCEDAYLSVETAHELMKEIEAGNIIYVIGISSDDGDPVGMYLHSETEGDDVGRYIKDKNLKIIERKYK